MKSVHLILVILACTACYLASTVLIPLVISFFIFMLLDPIVSWLQERHIPRSLGSALVVALFVGIAGMMFWAAYDAFSNIAHEFPRYSQKINSVIGEVQSRAATFARNTPSVPQINSDDVQKVEIVQGNSVTSFLLRGIGSLLGAITSLIFIPFLVLFFLMDSPFLAQNFKRLVNSQLDTSAAYLEISKMLRGFFLGNLVTGLAMATILSFVFDKIGLEHALPLAIAASFLNLIPLLGPFISVIFPFAQALIQFSTPGPFITIALTITGLHLAVTSFVVPKIIGTRVDVNSLIGTTGLLFWGWAWGAVGLFIAVPVTATIKILLQRNGSTQNLGLMFSDISVTHGVSFKRFRHVRKNPLGELPIKDLRL